MIIKMPYDKDETTHQHLPVEKISTEKQTPLPTLKVASFCKMTDATSTLLALKDQNTQVYQYLLLGCFFFFELLFLLISYQDGVLELKSPTHSWAFSSILSLCWDPFFQTALANETRLCPRSEGKQQKEKGNKTQAHLVCHFVFKEISENIMRLMANLKRLDDLWGVFGLCYS